MAEQKIIVPNIGDFKEVEVIEVLVKVGQEIKKDESVITLESDKSSVEVPSNFSGIIKEVNVKVGDKVSEGTTILSLESSEGGEKKIQVISKNKTTKNTNEIVDFPKNNQKKNKWIPSPAMEGKVKLASPNVRKFIRELGADISKIPGSERAGRITKDDVKDYVKNELTDIPVLVAQEREPVKNEYEHSEFGEIEIKDIPRVKRLSGPHLVKSWTEIPHVTQHEEIDITEMENFRNSLKDLYTGQKISITPLAFIMKAMVNGLKAYPNFNASINSSNGKVT